jgi:DNA ligase-1
MRLIIFATIFSIVLFAGKPNLLLLKVITGWVMSEKFDAIRAYWNENIISASSWFTKDYLPFEIDGELWSKRGDF